MGTKALIFPSCKELAERYSSGGYENAGWLERLGLRWHLFRCDLCRIYAQQVQLLGDAYRLSSKKAAAGNPELKKKLAERLRRKDRG